MYGPNVDERRLMEEWIGDLAAFVKNDHVYQYGTLNIAEFKAATPECNIRIERDEPWEELLKLARVFSRY